MSHKYCWVLKRSTEIHTNHKQFKVLVNCNTFLVSTVMD